MKRILITAASVIFSVFLMHQTGRGQEIKVGERLPDMQLKNVSNYPDSILQTGDFNNKLVLLDFWGTGCRSCINAFPELDSLQKAFGSDIQIILINKESRDSTERFLQKKGIKPPSVPLVFGDSIMHKLFPHRSVAHHVWVDDRKIVRYISYGYNTSYSNISDFVKGRNINIASKQDLFDFDYSAPMIAEGNGRWLPITKYYSSILKGSMGGQSGGLTLPNHITASSSILGLLKIAFSENEKYDYRAKESFRLDVKNVEKYLDPTKKSEMDSYIENNLYHYELWIPEDSKMDLYKTMQEDILRFFGLKSAFQPEERSCLFLVRTIEADKIKSKGGTSAVNLIGKDKQAVYDYRNVSLKMLIDGLNAHRIFHQLQTPVIDSTNYMENVDFVLTKSAVDSFDLNKLRNELKVYGLGLVEKKCLQNVLVISEK